MTESPTKVFISYSHDSDEHREFVRALSDRLRNQELECLIDQYINGFPPEGWQRWMENQIEAADFVLMICTPNYLKRYRGQETDGGKGVNFEGVIISQYLYDAYYQSSKFIPLIPKQGELEHVPMGLKRFSTFRMPEDYDTLYRVLTDQARFEPPEVAKVVKPSLYNRLFRRKHIHKQPASSIPVYDLRFPTTDLQATIGRSHMLSLLNQYWEQPSINVVVLHAFGGVGKTALVNLWRARLWRGDDDLQPAERVYAWSFQNQGSERAQTSSGEFFKHALGYFGAEQEKFSSEYDKGVHLAKLVKQQRTLLVLDGLEVFQPHNYIKELENQLNDQAMFALLKTLAQDNHGLCLITTRQQLDERLDGYKGILQQKLGNLSINAATQLLRDARIKGKDTELEAVAKEYRGHAYSLALLASYLRSYAHSDIQRRDTLPALMDDVTEENWHGQRIMMAYADALQGSPKLSLLYLVSVFDEAIERDVLTELMRAIGSRQTLARQLHLVALLDGKKWRTYVGELHQQGLLVSGNPELLEMHPLVRAFFRSEFAMKHKGYKQRVHEELYCFYRDLPEKELPDTLEEMQPLFSAVAHGCAAGLHRQVGVEIYYPRIDRKGEHYLITKLGAFSDHLATVTHFFTTPWQTPVAGLTDADQAVLLNFAGFGLLALGRLREAVEPIQAAIAIFSQQQDWKNVALNESILSELQLTLGDIATAVSRATQSVAYADQSGDLFRRMRSRTTHANALHQAGQAALARERFLAAEALQQEWQPDSPRLHSLPGFRYCDLLLAQGETAAVLERAEYAFEIAKRNSWLLHIALDQLSLGRAQLQQVLEQSTPNHPLSGKKHAQAADWLEQAVVGLRASGRQEYLPRGLLARATLFRHTHNFNHAHQNLQEVFDIADHSGMRLHLTDYHLEMSRLLLAEEKTENLQYHIDEAKRLINETGYHRRDAELTDLISKTTESTTQRTSACSTT